MTETVRVPNYKDVLYVKGMRAGGRPKKRSWEVYEKAMEMAGECEEGVM